MIDFWTHAVHIVCYPVFAVFRVTPSSGLPFPVAWSTCSVFVDSSLPCLRHTLSAAFGVLDSLYFLLSYAHPVSLPQSASGSPERIVTVDIILGHLESQTTCTSVLRNCGLVHTVTANAPKMSNCWPVRVCAVWKVFSRGRCFNAGICSLMRDKPAPVSKKAQNSPSSVSPLRRSPGYGSRCGHFLWTGSWRLPLISSYHPFPSCWRLEKSTYWVALGLGTGICCSPHQESSSLELRLPLSLERWLYHCRADGDPST